MYDLAAVSLSVSLCLCLSQNSLFSCQKICISVHKKKRYPKLHDIFGFHNINIHNDIVNKFSNPLLAKYEHTMKEVYEKIWKSSVIHSRKLEFYRKFINRYESKPYLEVIRTFDKRRTLPNFRISNHRSAIETGHYTRTAIDDRICIFAL